MIGRNWKSLLGGIFACFVVAVSVGCQTITPVNLTPPQSAIDRDGTYLITVTGGGDPGDLGTDPTLVIAGGLLTKLGATDMTPQAITVTGANYIWVSAASKVLSSQIPFPVTTTVTLNVDLQGNGTLVGTMTFSALGQTSNPLSVTLAKQ
ncbi:MAG: hypothetical protein HZA51_04640 [Planctomycetes bacterium]|nr:hypothetical protein [Planctomycetota bacterium]